MCQFRVKFKKTFTEVIDSLKTVKKQQQLTDVTIILSCFIDFVINLFFFTQVCSFIVIVVILRTTFPTRLYPTFLPPQLCKETIHNQVGNKPRIVQSKCSCVVHVDISIVELFTKSEYQSCCDEVTNVTCWVFFFI